MHFGDMQRRPTRYALHLHRCVHLDVYAPSAINIINVYHIIKRIICTLSVRARARASWLSATTMHTNNKKNIRGYVRAFP